MVGRLLALVLVAGCYRIPAEACIECTTTCPSGMTCENGVCVAPGEAACTPVMVDAPTNGCHSHMINADNDTYLDSPSIHGADDVLLAYYTRPILLDFDLAGMLGADEHVATASIHLTPVTTANGCGGVCHACPAFAATSYQLYWNISDWSQTAATSSFKRASTYWDQAYATGTGDRSIVISRGPISSGGVDIALSAQQIAALPPTLWMVNSHLSVQLLLDNTAAFAATEQGCAPRQGPQLSVTICP
jgi:hypothetical protein